MRFEFVQNLKMPKRSLTVLRTSPELISAKGEFKQLIKIRNLSNIKHLMTVLIASQAN